MNSEAMLTATCSDNTMKRKSSKSRRQLHWHYVHWRTPHCILILVILCYAIGIGKANTSPRTCTKVSILSKFVAKCDYLTGQGNPELCVYRCTSFFRHLGKKPKKTVIRMEMTSHTLHLIR